MIGTLVTQLALSATSSNNDTKPSDLSLALVDGDWVRAESIVKTHPQQANQWSKRIGFFEGKTDAYCLPLHEACVNPLTPSSTINAILCANLQATKTMESSYRRLPLHCICRRRITDPKTMNETIEIVKQFIKANPAACLIPDDLGRLPIHYALSNGANTQIIHLILSAQPNAAKGVDHRGWTPLHVACSVNAKIGIISALLYEYPEAVILHTKKGSKPIDCYRDAQAQHNNNNNNSENADNDHDKIIKLLKNAYQEFNKNFKISPLHNRTTPLLQDNHDAVLV